MVKNISIVLLVLFNMFVASSLCHADEPQEEQQHYKVGLGDVLDISVLDHDELKTTAPVTSDGSITFPYIGSINVKGLSLSDIEKEIEKRLSSSYIKYPVVSVTLTRFESVKFFVYGEVKNPGRYTLEGNMTVFKAISSAGGITADGIYGKVKVRRRQKVGGTYQEININLKNIKESTMNCDMPIEDEDVIVVERNKDFYVYGEVSKPGKYTLGDQMTVLQAISIAGGITTNGLYGKIKVRRKQKMEGAYKEINIDFKNTKDNALNSDMPVEDGDVIVVERNKDFFVYGEVARPGKYTLEDQMTVLRAISIAGGFAKFGSPDRVKILRTVHGNTRYENIKVDTKGAVKGDVDKDIRLESGDIVIVMEGIL